MKPLQKQAELDPEPYPSSIRKLLQGILCCLCLMRQDPAEGKVTIRSVRETVRANVRAKIDWLQFLLDVTCSCSFKSVSVGNEPSVYHPMKSRSGKTCFTEISFFVKLHGRKKVALLHDLRCSCFVIKYCLSILLSCGIGNSKEFTISTSRPDCCARSAPYTRAFVISLLFIWIVSTLNTLQTYLGFLRLHSRDLFEYSGLKYSIILEGVFIQHNQVEWHGRIMHHCSA